MTAKKCDRCGKYYDLHRNGSCKYYLSKIDTLNGRHYSIDLCEECSNDLQEWFKEPGKIEESEEKK